MARSRSVWTGTALRTAGIPAVAILAVATLSGALGGCSGRSGATAAPGASTSTSPPSTGVTGSSSGGPVTTGPAPGSTAGPGTAPTTASHASTASRPATVSAHSGGLTVTLTVAATRARPGAAVDFTVTARDTGGFGFFGYQLSYGDGATEHNIVPHNCPVSAAASGGDHTWRFSHGYRSPGSYTAVVQVQVTCIGDHATTAPVTLVIA